MVFEIDAGEKVGELVARHWGLARLFEEEGIDYCCGGRESLRHACEERGIDIKKFLHRVEKLDEGGTSEKKFSTLTELIDHIVSTHHVFLRSELPLLNNLTLKVLTAHGDKDPRFLVLRETFLELSEDLTQHMLKEEQILFPMIREMEESKSVGEFHYGSIACPIRQMETEHDQAGSALCDLRELTDEYLVPDCACNTHKAMLASLANLEKDLHQHIHKENNILFPRAIRLASEMGI
jgi:regulator of cell morphogenesis and NO signaling